MAKTQWEASTKFKGVRWYKHDTRKHGIKYDRCFAIRYAQGGKRYESVLGWETEGWSEETAYLKRAEYLHNLKTGEGPYSRKDELAAEKETNEATQKADQEKAAQERLEAITFGTVFDAYMEWAKTNKKHWGNDEYRYRVHLEKHLHDIRFKDISTFQLEEIKAKLLKKLAPATVKHCIVVIRQVYNRAQEGSLGIDGKPFEWEGLNPVSGVKLKNLGTHNEKIRTIDTLDSKEGKPGRDEKLLMDMLKEKSFITYGLAMTSLYAGLRFAEAANLRWMHIDLISGHINCLDGKGGLDRKILIPIHPKLKVELEEQKKRQNSPSPDMLVWPNRNGSTVNKISATFPRAVKELGFNKGIDDRRMKLDFHSLRHSFATRLADAGTPLTVLRDLLGHRDLTMVSRYAKSSQSIADEAIARIGVTDT
ncbi:tyrosine-type recombinase/integrase [Maridesulfovibrio sp.]|uniref:tyrosine-type recombinase/integrase n=1 Tax=Maridesulfovibrio sp. TaxID=2795000 RepID=UPI0029C9BAE9|nr:tyrosine-type recombinase/integrase [Maridesulfovibrio sp.]